MRHILTQHPVIIVFMGNDDFDELTRLWALRAIFWRGTISRFVKENSFGDDDLANALGLDYWLSENDEVDRERFLRVKGLPSHIIKAMRGSPLDEKVKEECKTAEARFNRKAIVGVLRGMHETSERSASRIHPKCPPYFEKNCEFLKRIYGLSDIELRILQFKILENQVGMISDAVRLCNPRRRDAHIDLLATILQESSNSIGKSLDCNSRLFRLKLIQWRRSRENLNVCDDGLAERIFSGPCGLDDITKDVAYCAPPATLKFTHYPHMQNTLRPLRCYLRNALRTKDKGVNIFMYGAPGTGKSELSRVIARDLRAQLYEISSEDEEGSPIRADRRMDALVKAGEIMKEKRSILVFDEAEDIFRASSFMGRSLASERKGWTNRMLENNPVPLIWISNSLTDLDPAFSRRFDFIFEVKTPPKSLRKKLYKEICGPMMPERIVEKAVSCDALTPAVLMRARKVTDTVCKLQRSADYGEIFEARLEQTIRAQGHDSTGFTKSQSTIPTVFGLEYPKFLQALGAYWRFAEKAG